MSKVKQWAEDTAEKAVDKIILGFKHGVLNKDTAMAKILDVDNVINELKNNSISKEAAKAKIMNVQNVDLCSIDENNVDEVIDMSLEAA